MDPFARPIIGLEVHVGIVNGFVLCRIFNAAISAEGIPKYLSPDYEPVVSISPLAGESVHR
jgi:hypothetical protein